MPSQEVYRWAPRVRLDFTTKQEARNVYDNTASIHLYGRHLVLEWAEEDGGVEALREKREDIKTVREEGDIELRVINAVTRRPIIQFWVFGNGGLEHVDGISDL
ncbi:hypothetical protein BC937DRAFT_94610 [Endogone sp. FLAS-F59071]|nr:hypothetical protein BC937DRAFT_94610 [Endogone sp. FLAS-F59071]|eukprot:RUS13913.1 hypothetical protein BC937DRAFT_94610 [Endogone sp. FLAS-F59071]